MSFWCTSVTYMSFQYLLFTCMSITFMTFHPSIHCSMGSAPVGAQCPLTSSLGEFLGYWDWVWYPGLSPVLVPIALPFAFHISVFSIHSSSPAIGFHSSIFYGGGICTPWHSQTCNSHVIHIHVIHIHVIHIHVNYMSFTYVSFSYMSFTYMSVI